MSGGDIKSHALPLNDPLGKDGEAAERTRERCGKDQRQGKARYFL